MNEHVAKKHNVAPAIEERLERVAEQQQRSIDAVLESALVDYLDRVESRTELNAEVDRRYERYRQTGLHVTNDEVKEWLFRRAAGERRAPPKAHT